MSQTFKVTLLPAGNTVELNSERSVLDQLKTLGIYVKSTCGGKASCADCVIKVIDGKEFCNSIDFPELKLLGNVFHITKERLSCQLKISGPISIDLSSHDRLTHDQQTLKRTTSGGPSQVLLKKKAQIENDKSDEEKKSDDWHRYWEKDKDKKPKKMGGNRKPRAFKTEN